MSVDDDIKWLEDDMARAVFEVLTSRTKIPYTSMTTFKYDPSKIVMTFNGQVITPADGTFIEVDRDEPTEMVAASLVVGDVIVEVHVGGWQKVGPFEVTTINGNRVEGVTLGKTDQQLLLTTGDQARLRVRRTAPVKAKQQANHWNGKCARCGRNTYTGMNNIEHEGDCR